MHEPVLLKEVLGYLAPAKNIIDGTVSGGGHTFALLKADESRKVLGIEWDPEIFEELKTKAVEFGDRLQIVNDSYVNLKKVAAENNFRPDGILFDFGLSSWHYEGSGRGFSFRRDEVLDMRFHPEEGAPTAADIVNTYDVRALTKVIEDYGEEQFAEAIAKSIIHSRQEHAILTADKLVAAIETAVPWWYKKKKIHCATKTFQALRIAVNHELENVEAGVKEALDVLEPGGRIVTIAFHGLEDKILKEYFKQQVKDGIIKFVEKKTVQAAWEERKQNPRSRSAKMRVVEKI